MIFHFIYYLCYEYAHRYYKNKSYTHLHKREYYCNYEYLLRSVHSDIIIEW